MGSLLATTGLLRTLCLALACTFAPILFYNYYTYPVYSKDSYTTWFCTAIVGFSIHIFTLAVAYKESNSLHSAIWILVMYWTGTVATGIYIFIHFLKLSPEESAQDPIYHVLLRHEHKISNEKPKSEKKNNNKSSSVVPARAAFILWACLLIPAVIYSVVTVGSPFRLEVLLSPWMIATLIDYAFLSVIFLVWIAHKEASWLSVSLWILLYVCLGGLATCAYMTKQLFQLTSQDPLYLVLVKHNNNSSRRAAKRTYTTVR